MKSMATQRTQKQLAYLHYWRRRGVLFNRSTPIPETTTVRPVTSRDHLGGVVLLAVMLLASIDFLA